MTATEQRVTGFCSCCDKPMWAAHYADRGFRVEADTETGVCNECPTGTETPEPKPVARREREPGEWAAKVQANRDRVIGHWLSVQDTGVTMKAAAEQAGMTYAAYWQTIQRAREAGDQRVPYVPRTAVNHQRQGPDWDQILDRWHTELQPAGMDYREAADAVGVPVSTFEARLRAARNAGDQRGAKRQETEGKVEAVAEQSDQPRGTEANPWEAHEVEPNPAYGNDVGQLRYDRPWELGEVRATAVVNENGGLTYVDETDERQKQLATWHDDDQAELAAGEQDVAS